MKFDEEEERRLFYVSITRAKDKLILTSCNNRWRFGTLTPMEISRFVGEMRLEAPAVDMTDDGADGHSSFVNAAEEEDF